VSFFVAKDDNSDGTGLAVDSTTAGDDACGSLLAVAAVGTRSELPHEDTFLSDPNVRFYLPFMDL
jgi:hypothetical protein